MKSITFMLILSFATASQSFADTWENDDYTSHVIVANNGDVVFRFIGEGFYTYCDTGSEFQEELILITDGERERTYFLNAKTKATGDSGLCDGNAPIPTIAYYEEVQSQWRKVPVGDAVTFIMKNNVSIEIQ